MQHALKMLTHRINIISGLTLESQNESWDLWGGFKKFIDRRLVTTEGIQFIDLRFWDAARLGDIATHNTQPSRTPDRGPFVHHQVVWQ